MSENQEKAVTAVKDAPLPVAMGKRGVALNNIDEVWRFCDAIQKSGVAPKGMQETAKIFAVVTAGAELGLTPFRALSNMKIINGRVGPMGSLAKALVRAANVLATGTGFKEDFIGEEGSDDFAARITTRRGTESDVYITTFSVKDAKLAKLWGKVGKGGPTPWVTYPKRMLMWRAIGFHMDDYYSDVIMGMQIAEVLDDYPDSGARLATTMEPVEPTKDPLLDDPDAKYKAELEATAATMQPPATGAEGRVTATEVLSHTGETREDPNPDPTQHPIITDPIGGPEDDPPTESAAEIAEDMADLLPKGVDPQTGEYVDTGGPVLNTDFNDLIGPDGEAITKIGQAPQSRSPLEAVMAEMTEEEAAADLAREGIDSAVVKEEDLAPVDPGNKAEEGADQEDIL